MDKDNDDRLDQTLRGATHAPDHSFRHGSNAGNSCTWSHRSHVAGHSAPPNPVPMAAPTLTKPGNADQHKFCAGIEQHLQGCVRAA